MPCLLEQGQDGKNYREQYDATDYRSAAGAPVGMVSLPHHGLKNHEVQEVVLIRTPVTHAIFPTGLCLDVLRKLINALESSLNPRLR